MDERKKYLPAAIVFLAVIAAFTIISLVKPQSDFSESENRALAERPDFDADDFLQGDYQEEYEDYLSDQMVGRDYFVKVKTQIDIWLGKKDINDVYLAGDDYLIEKYAMADFDEEQVEDNIWYLSEFLADMKDCYGEAHVQCMLVPSKDTALSSLLPDHAVPFDDSFVAEELGADVLDLTDVLSEHDDEYIYYRTDHHWTTLGAYYAYCAYKEMRGEEPAAKEQYTVVEVAQDFYGTTYDKIQKCKVADTVSKWQLDGADAAVQVVFDDGEMEWESCYDESYLSEKDKYCYFFGGNTAKIEIATEADNGKCLLLLKDSYSNSFVEFLFPDYEYIYMIDLRYTNDDIYTLMDEIDAEHAISDVLVMYNTEKFMDLDCSSLDPSLR